MKKNLLRLIAMFIMLTSVCVITISESSVKEPRQIKIKIPIQAPLRSEDTQYDEAPAYASSGDASVITHLTSNDVSSILNEMNDTTANLQLIRFVEANNSLTGVYVTLQELQDQNKYSSDGSFEIVTRLPEIENTQITKIPNGYRVQVNLDLTQIKYAIDQVWQMKGATYTLAEETFDDENVSLVVTSKSLRRLVKELENRELNKFVTKFTVERTPVE